MPSLAFWEPLPNIHPATVHFVIALVPVAVLLDVASLVLRRRRWLDRAAAVLYLLGAVGAVVAFLTGRRAAEGLAEVPPQALGVLSSHEDLALWTAWVVGIVALGRVMVAALDGHRERLGRVPLRAALLAVALVGTALLFATAYRGGELVFQHGVGVAAVPALEVAPEPAEPVDLEEVGPAEERFERREDGSTVWRPLAADGEALGTILEAAPGSDADAVRWLAPEPGEEARRGLALELAGRAVLFLPDELGDVQVDLEVELAGFAGTLGPVHHGRDADDFQAFFVGTEGQGRLARLEDGEERVLDAGETAPLEGRRTLTVSASGRHFYGRVDGEVVAHGHIQPWERGACGVYLEGDGEIRVLSVRVQPL